MYKYICKNHQVVHLNLAYFTTLMYVCHASKKKEKRSDSLQLAAVSSTPYYTRLRIYHSSVSSAGICSYHDVYK